VAERRGEERTIGEHEMKCQNGTDKRNGRRCARCSAAAVTAKVHLQPCQDARSRVVELLRIILIIRIQPLVMFPRPCFLRGTAAVQHPPTVTSIQCLSVARRTQAQAQQPHLGENRNCRAVCSSCYTCGRTWAAPWQSAFVDPACCVPPPQCVSAQLRAARPHGASSR
jgi:hypothetical protein